MTLNRKNKSSESGQTLILAVLAMVVIVVAIIFLFDLQTIIRTKIKSQTAVDAAALAGAKWQQTSLNLIGELNLVKACTVLIADVPTDSGYSADPLYEQNDLVALEEASVLLSQMQLRISFVGPLIGFGAAQQAAKNNGLNYNEEYGKMLRQSYEYVNPDGGSGDMFYGEEVASQEIFGYAWREPYAEMLEQLLDRGLSSESLEVCKGVAVVTGANWASAPDLTSNTQIFNGFMENQNIYDAINGNYWCYIRELLRMDFNANGGKWWGDIEIVLDNAFSKQAELLSLYVNYSQGEYAYNQAEATGAFYGTDATNSRLMDNANTSNGYNRADESALLRKNYDEHDPVLWILDIDTGQYEESDIPYDKSTNRIEIVGDADTINRLYLVDASGNPVLDGVGNRIYTGYTMDADYYWDPLPQITWAVYDTGKWRPYYNTGFASSVTEWEESWGTYLRDDFKEGYGYYGAVSCTGTLVPPSTLSGRWGTTESESGDTENKYLGDSMAFGGESSKTGANINEYGENLKNAEKSMQGGLPYVAAFSAAKPFGRIPTANGYLAPADINMILPVFDKAMALPFELPGGSGNFSLDVDPYWAAFKAEYLPVLGTADSLNEMPTLLAGNEHWNAGWFTQYHNALVRLNAPSWRQEGLDWLDAERSGHDVYDDSGNFVEHVVDQTNEDTCTYWQSSGPGNRSGPSVPF